MPSTGTSRSGVGRSMVTPASRHVIARASAAWLPSNGTGMRFERHVAPVEHGDDHAVETEALTVLRGEDAGDAVGLERIDLRRG